MRTGARFSASLLPPLENRAPVRMASQFPPPGQPLGISRGQFPRHAATRLPRDPPEAFMRWLLVTVKRENGEHVSYDPRRLHGVTLYRETERGFSQGDRVQFTAPDREQHIANRELGTIEKIDDSGNLQVRIDSGRKVSFNIKENPHLDYGYAVTSHSSQGQTADRVLVHVDTEQ